MPPSSIVFVIHDQQDTVFAGGVGQWLECIVVSITRMVNSLEVVSMQRLHGFAVLVELKKFQSGSNFGCPLLVLCLLSMMSRMLSSQVVLGNGFSASS